MCYALIAFEIKEKKYPDDLCEYCRYIVFNLWTIKWLNHIGGVMVSVLTSSAIDREFKPRSGQPKNHKIGICCFSDKHPPLGRKSKDWLARNKDNVSEWGDMSVRRLLFQRVATLKIQLSMLV